MPQPLRVATCQFPVSGDLRKNGRHIRRFIAQAARKGAHVVHFCETALTGYPGGDFPDLVGYDWTAWDGEYRAIADAAREKRVWVLLGTPFPGKGRARPTNSILAIDPQGQIAARYDKRDLTPGDRKCFRPGRGPVVISVNGWACGILICADIGSPRLFRQYESLGVKVLFQSFYNAGAVAAKDAAQAPAWTDPGFLDTACFAWLSEVMPAWVQTRAVDHRVWILANNSSRPLSAWGTCIARPDGRLAAKMGRHTRGMLVQDIVV